MKHKLINYKGLLRHSMTTFCSLLGTFRLQLPVVVAVAAIMKRENTVLLIDREDGLGYCLPGGLVQGPESSCKALEREVREETGYQVEICAFIGEYSGLARDARYPCLQLAYVATIVGGQEHPSSEGTLSWFSFWKLPSNMAFDHRQVIEDYIQKFLPNPYAKLSQHAALT